MRSTHRAAALAALAASALAALAAAPGAARAQELREPRARQGYYAAFGAHGAFSHLREEGEGLGLFGGFTTSLRLGQMLGERLGLGIQLDLGGSSAERERSTVFGAGIAGQLEVARDLAVHGIVGLGVVSLSDPDEPEELRGAYGAAYTLGVTYDWFPAPRRTGGFAVTPGAQLRALPADSMTAVSLVFGVEVSYWSGLPANRLDLPPEEAFD